MCSEVSHAARAGARRHARSRVCARLAAALAVALALVVVAGCGSGDGGSATTGDAGGGTTAAATKDLSRTLTVGVPSAPSSLDPARDPYDVQSLMRYLSNEPLIVLEPDGTPGPGLATSWQYVGSGNRAFELTLRRDARFSDGTPLDAAAVKGWFEYFAKAGGPFANEIAIASVDTPDEWTVRLNLRGPDANVAYMLSGINNHGFVSSPKAVARPALLGKETHGVGPYTLDPAQTVAGDHYTFVPNKRYYDPSKVRWGKVVVKVISSPTTMLQALKTGQLDVAVGNASTADSAQAAGLAVHHAEAGWDGLQFADLGGRVAKPLADVRVRQALNYAVDREAIATALMGEFGEPTSQWRTVDGFDAASDDYYDYDPEKAKELLADAGYADGFALRVIDEGFTGNLGDPMVQAVAKYLKAVGVELQITTAANAGEFNSKFLTYPVIQHNFGAATTLLFHGLFYSQDGLIGGAWKNPADPVLEKLARQGSVAAPEEAGKIWQQYSERMVTQGYQLTVFTFPYLFYASDGVDGVESSVNRWVLFRPVLTEWSPK